MHHPPFGVGVPAFDEINLMPSDARAFGEVLQGRRNTRHLFFGHIHRTIFGSWRGLPFSTLPATAYQSLLDFTASEDFFTHGPPAYGVILLDAEQVTIHTESYLHRGPIYHPDGRCVRY
jgi:3',5'-cyclic-AMP phosphodiesterase